MYICSECNMQRFSGTQLQRCLLHLVTGSQERAQVIGWENIELISDRPLEVMLEDMARLKQEYPDRRALALKTTGIL